MKRNRAVGKELQQKEKRWLPGREEVKKEEGDFSHVTLDAGHAHLSVCLSVWHIYFSITDAGIRDYRRKTKDRTAAAALCMYRQIQKQMQSNPEYQQDSHSSGPSSNTRTILCLKNITSPHIPSQKLALLFLAFLTHNPLRGGTNVTSTELPRDT